MAARLSFRIDKGDRGPDLGIKGMKVVSLKGSRQYAVGTDEFRHLQWMACLS